MKRIIDTELIKELLETEWGYEGIRDDLDNLFLKNGTPIDNATVCDIEQIRAEVKHLLNRPSLTHIVGYDKGFVDGIDKVLHIIDKYTGKDNEQ